jgi:hypothetical protein
MTVLNDAAAIYLGPDRVARVYVGDARVWPPAAPGYADHIKAQTPLAYWRLGEPSGTVAADEMGYHDATYTGNPTLGTPGLVGDDDTAMTVAGVLMQGATAGNTAFQLYADFSIEAWFQTSNAGTSFRSIVVKMNDYSMFAMDNVLGVYEWGSGLIVSSGVNIADGQRHHGVVVFGINYGPAESQMYLDGVAVGPPFTHSLSSQAQQLTFGYNDFATQEFNGTIDEVAIYNRRLTPAEVLGNYQAGSAT